MSFQKLGLTSELLLAVEEQGYKEPTAIQRRAIPAVLNGKDVVALAQTGTGKTAGFTLPLLQILSSRPSKQPATVRALILVPTRELAAQVSQSVSIYGKHLPLKSAVVFGGIKIGPQIAKLRRGVDILIATPGRLLDLLGQNALTLNSVEFFVLDEADRMLDMGFIHDIRRVIKLLPHKRQSLLFSATFSAEIKTLANTLLRSPEYIEIARQGDTADLIKQEVYLVDQKRKRELLSYTIGSKNWQQVLVFMRTKHGANRLTKQLEEDGLTAATIHGNKSQGARTRALADFKEGKVRVLVATDVAARGIDINKLPHVVNFDLPNVPEDYVHRIGRTGRASNNGVAISLVSIDEAALLRDIETLLKCKLPKITIPGYEPDQSIKAEPIHLGRNTRNNPGKPANKPFNRHKKRTDQRHSNSNRRNTRGGAA